MIDERSLLAAIKDAWRTGGYSVAGNGGELVLQGSGWLAVLPRGIVPRKVLALLVEHLGEIPEGAAWKVYKKQGAQAQMVDMALEAVDTIRRELESEPNPREAHSSKHLVFRSGRFFSCFRRLISFHMMVVILRMARPPCRS